MIYFDHHNYKQEWIAKAEMEAARRKLVLRPITATTLEEIRCIPIAADIVLEHYEPRRSAAW